MPRTLERLLRAGPLVLLGAAAPFAALHHAHGSPPAGAATTQELYLRDCATCHGADAKGTKDGPSLQGAGAAFVDYELTTGRMPLDRPGDEVARHAPRYDPATIDALVAYVTSLAPGGPAVPTVDATHADLANGGEVFRLQCAACHEWAGQGGALRSGESPSLHASTARQIGEAVRVGPGTMPVFGIDALDDRQLADLAAYVRYLEDPQDRGGHPLWHLGPLPEGMLAFAAAIVLTSALVLIGERR